MTIGAQLQEELMDARIAKLESPMGSRNTELAIFNNASLAWNTAQCQLRLCHNAFVKQRYQWGISLAAIVGQPTNSVLPCGCRSRCKVAAMTGQ